MSAETATVETILADAGLTGWLDEVGAYINRQRWSGAQDTSVTRVTVDDAAVLLEDQFIAGANCKRTADFVWNRDLSLAGDSRLLLQRPIPLILTLPDRSLLQRIKICTRHVDIPARRG